MPKAEAMTSRERILAAASCRPADHVPLMFHVFADTPKTWPEHVRCDNGFELIELRDKLGVDSVMYVAAPVVMDPQVTTKFWKETETDGALILCKEYDTPAGKLLHKVRYVDDKLGDGWARQGVSDVVMYEDFNVPRAVRHLISGPQDLPKLRYLLAEPSAEQLGMFRERAAKRLQLARRHRIATCGRVFGTDPLMWLCGVQGAVLAAMDDPAFLHELVGILIDHDKRRAEFLIDVGVDIIDRRGWYDTTRFWSPKIYRQFFAPGLKELADFVHAGGAKLAYSMSTGIMPLLDTFVDVGIDMLVHVDPVMGDADLAVVKQKLGGRVAVRGGINAPLTLSRASEHDIRRAVDDAIRILAVGGGFILSPVDTIDPACKWEKIEILIDAWKEYRSVT